MEAPVVARILVRVLDRIFVTLCVNKLVFLMAEFQDAVNEIAAMKEAGESIPKAGTPEADRSLVCSHGAFGGVTVYEYVSELRPYRLPAIRVFFTMSDDPAFWNEEGISWNDRVNYEIVHVVPDRFYSNSLLPDVRSEVLKVASGRARAAWYGGDEASER